MNGIYEPLILSLSKGERRPCQYPARSIAGKG
jgi:hypothetical protein